MSTRWQTLSQDEKRATYRQSSASARRRAKQDKERLSDRYIKKCLGFYRDVPEALIRAKRAHLRLQYALRGTVPPPNKLVRLVLDGIACEKRLRELIATVKR